MSNQVPTTPVKMTSLDIHEDPEQALKKASARASPASAGPLFGMLLGGMGLVVVLALMPATSHDYSTHNRELGALLARGSRARAQLAGEPVYVARGRYSRSYWYAEYSYIVNGSAYAGSARMYERPESTIAVVFDPRIPAAHRAVGSMEPSNVDGRSLITLGAFAVLFGFVFLVSGFEWLDSRRK